MNLICVCSTKTNSVVSTGIGRIFYTAQFLRYGLPILWSRGTVENIFINSLYPSVISLKMKTTTAQLSFPTLF